MTGAGSQGPNAGDDDGRDDDEDPEGRGGEEVRVLPGHGPGRLLPAGLGPAQRGRPGRGPAARADGSYRPGAALGGDEVETRGRAPGKCRGPGRRTRR